MLSTLLLFLPIALVVVAVQATLIERMDVAGIHPDLVLVSILLLTMISGRRTAAFAAIIVAPFYDALSGMPLGTSILPLLSVVFLAGIGERSLFGARLGWPVIVAVLATVLAGLITMAELNLMGWLMQWSDMILRVLFPTAVINALLVLILYVPAEYLRDRRTLALG